MLDCSVILLSGGVGSRFGSSLPKQYHLLLGKEIILHSLDLFLSLEFPEIIVVCSEQEEPIFGGKNVIFARQGKRRQDSMLSGLKKATLDFVCIHDGARPLVRKEDVIKCYLAAKKNGAAALGTRVADTIKKEENGSITTLDRASLWQMQTPQIIKRELLLKAVENLGTVTDDLSIIENFGHTPAIIEGSASNIKITNPIDLQIAEVLCNAIK
jgi:2-C-methyl-D-erythritol 4-phosphate cytidylyltransferase